MRGVLHLDFGSGAGSGSGSGSGSGCGPLLRAVTVIAAWHLTACSQPPAPSVAPEVAVITAESLPLPGPFPPGAIAWFPGRGRITVEGRSGGPAFVVELARTDAERAQGMMFRQRMGDDEGMLFFMPRANDWTFYMRNTYVRLDMLFLDQDFRVVGVVADVPPLTEDLRSVGKPSHLVLELAAHQAARHGIGPGTRLAFQPLPDALPQPGRASAARFAPGAGAP